MPRNVIARLASGLLLLVVTAGLFVIPREAAFSAEALRGRAGILGRDAGGHVQALADDAFEGREAGRRGGRAAGRYVEQVIAPLGFVAAGDNGSFFQSFASRHGSLRNILALLPGADPACQDELVVVGAHYDHVGYGNQRNSYGPFGFVHNGADDNASGVAGLIEIAEALASLPQPPRRPILLAFWDGEEQGLLGSKHFLRSRPASIEGKTIVFSINLDMIGRLRQQTVSVYGTRSAVGLEELVTRTNCLSGGTALQLAFDWKVEPDSDHYSFLQAGIPTLMFHTGLHNDYHRPSDDAHLVNLDGLEPVARLTFDTLLQVADATGSAPDSPGRWGIGIRADSANPTAALVVAMRAGSPAERGGLRLKDRIVEIDGTPITGQQDMMQRLAAIGKSSAVDVTVSRKGQYVRLTWND
ncbi:MAG: M20/M25/M40 family metallo-hydrolase [Planctomycetia bacterium]|nr:M20/M25/M40 family metallo-hydrolase [Planctomycetia bacterium]